MKVCRGGKQQAWHFPRTEYFHCCLKAESPGVENEDIKNFQITNRYMCKGNKF